MCKLKGARVRVSEMCVSKTCVFKIYVKERVCVTASETMSFAISIVYLHGDDSLLYGRVYDIFPG